MMSHHLEFYHLAAVDCGALDNPLNGVVETPQGTILSNLAIYSCNINFVTDDISIRICQENGEWSGVPPTCRCEQLEKLCDLELYVAVAGVIAAAAVAAAVVVIAAAVAPAGVVVAAGVVAVIVVAIIVVAVVAAVVVAAGAAAVAVVAAGVVAVDVVAALCCCCWFVL